MQRVVVLGGGFAGVRLARRLTKAGARQHLAVTLVSRDPAHVYAPGLYQLAGAVTDAARRKAMDKALALPLRRVLAGLPVTLVQGEVISVDTDSKTVSVADGRTLQYDILAVAIGSEAAHYGIPGLKEHAITLKTMADADKVNRTIAAKMRGRDKPLRVTVGGGGPTGVELSAMLAEKLGAWQAGVRVTLVEGAPLVLNGFADKVRAYATAELVRRDVSVRTGVAIKSATDRAVTLADGATVDHDVLIWTGGTQAPQLLGTLPFVLEKGRLATDAPLACVPKEGGTEPDVYALGDASAFHYGSGWAPWTVNAALQEADHAAKNILRRIAGMPEKPFKLPHQPFVIPLGSTGGVAEVWRLPLRGRIVQFLALWAEARYLLSMLSLRETWKLIRLRRI